MILEKSVGAGEFEIENTQRAVAEIPVESEKEDNVQEADEQQEPLRHSETVNRPPVYNGIDDYTNIANVTSYVVYQAVEITKEPTTTDDTFNNEHSKEWKEAADLEHRA